MNKRILAILALTGVLGVAPPTAMPASRIDIAKVTCSDLIKAEPLDRAAVVMFYWGYAAAKAGVSSFQTNILKTATQHVMGICTKKPSETMMEAMQNVDIKAF